jgi:SAM-dependent MidA family methyltransferase
MRMFTPRLCTWAGAEQLSRAAGVAVIFDYGEEAQGRAVDDNLYTAVLYMGWSRTVISCSCVAMIFDYGEDAQGRALDENVYNAVLHMS